MTSVIDNPKEHVWDALIDGFEKYLSVLTERAALIQETDALEQQVHLIVPILCNYGGYTSHKPFCFLRWKWFIIYKFP